SLAALASPPPPLDASCLGADVFFSAEADSCGWHCDCSDCASALAESNPRTVFTSFMHTSILPADLAALAAARCFLAKAAATWSFISCAFWQKYVLSEAHFSYRFFALSPSPESTASLSELCVSSARASSAIFFLFGAGASPAASSLSSAAMYL